MKKLFSIFACLFLSFTFVSTSVSATSWAELDPKDVIDNAEVILTGKYDFTSKPVRSKFIFQGYDFHIKDVYKGNVSGKITVGIDMYDVGWAEQFQNEGGEFLLFLIKSNDADFLVPYGGPNGMIQIKDGKVIAAGGNKTFFQEILESQPQQTIDNPIENNDTNKSYTTVYITLIVLVGAVLFLLYRNKRTK